MFSELERWGLSGSYMWQSKYLSFDVKWKFRFTAGCTAWSHLKNVFAEKRGTEGLMTRLLIVFPARCDYSYVYLFLRYHFSSVQFSRSVMSDSLWPHELQHARPPCLSPTPRVHSDSRPSSQWCHPAVSSSVVPFSSCPQSLPASEFIPMSQLFAWGGQSTGVSALASFLPKKSQGWSPSEWAGWISL